MADQEYEIIPAQTAEIVPVSTGTTVAVKEETFLAKLQQKLALKNVNEDKIATKIADLLDTTITTNSWEVYKDGKTILETVKLVLQLNGAKWLGPTTQINFFAASAAKDGKLEY